LRGEDGVVEMCGDILKLLTKTKEDIFEIFHEHNYDPAYFNINILLSIIIDDIELKVSEGWDALDDR